MYRLLFLFGLVLLMNGCGSSAEEQSSKKVELTISAATSMQDVLTEMKDSFEKKHPYIRIAFNFGASGALLQQITQGAPVDLFLSASVDKFNALVEDGLIYDNLRRKLIGNEIVLIVPKGDGNNIESMDELKTKAERISIGIPESVPVGKYAKEALVSLGLWNDIESKIIFAKDVRQVLTYVETGNVDAGIVYKTDAGSSDQIQIGASVDTSQHSEILYPMGVIKDTTHIKEATIFYEYLSSEEALSIFEEYGFKRLD